MSDQNQSEKIYPEVASTVGKPSESGNTEIATFAAGCFWTVEAVNRAIQGVLETKCGFMGGQTSNPEYKEVYTDETGHAEVVQIHFDPEIVSFSELLKSFFENHNPTQENGQGEDIGTRYRSEIFYHNQTQQAVSEKMLADLDKLGKYPKPIATKITPASEFFAAEEYHQRYFEKNGISACGL